MTSKKSKKFTDSEGRVWDSKDEATMYRWLTEDGWIEEEDFTVQGKFIPGRRFRGDFVFEKEKIIVEVMGLDIRGYAGHNNVFVMTQDHKRHLLAAKHGWTILYWSKGVTKYELFSCLNVLLKGESIKDNL